MNKIHLGGIGLLAIAGVTLLVGKREQVKRENITPNEFQLDTRHKIVFIAANEIGPQDPNKYWADVLPGVSSFKGEWCGGFTLWVLHQAGIAKDINWTIGKGYCYQLPITNNPMPGDIAYIDKPYQHHAIVESVTAEMVSTIDGNQPGNTVARRLRPKSAITAFYSIDGLIGSDNVQV